MRVYELESVSYKYLDRFPALDNVSLDIDEGEMVVIVGANGSGKSTLLQILDGLIFPKSGKVKAFGYELTEDLLEDEGFRRFFRSSVGLVFQDPDVQLFCPTVWDEIAFGPLQLGIPEEEVRDRVEKLLEAFEIGKLKDRAPYSLSGGEKKRVSIASVMAVEPKVLLLDEPTAGLDPRSQVWMIELIYRMHDEGRTVVMATHDLNLVADIPCRVVVLSEDHRIVAQGDPDRILGDLDMLLSVNLIHEHAHRHKDVYHRHPHSHILFHRHRHEGEL
jgi:cobalt/nickel transport system ATP-binding protein